MQLLPWQWENQGYAERENIVTPEDKIYLLGERVNQLPDEMKHAVGKIMLRLGEHYETSAEVAEWLLALHPQLDGSAMAYIEAGKPEAVIQILDRLDAGAYL